MINKIIIAAACAVLTGCANLKYPGWQSVNISESAFNKPCSYVLEESCSDGDGCNDWYKKRAIIFHANTVVKGKDKNTAKYFYCSAGLPPFLEGPEAAWIVRNIYNKTATKLDLNKSYDECAYQAHMATVDTSRRLPERVYINTRSYDVNSAQLSAIRMDQINNNLHDLNLSVENINLKYECLKAKGFVFTRSADKKDHDEVNKFCPGLDNSTEPCFVPAL